MQKSQEINELAAALAKARAKFGKVEKSSANPFYKSKYADLAVVIDATYKSLSENGLSVMQFPGEVNGGAVTVLTMLCHASGQWVSEETTMPVSKNDAQGIGSALTYGRRYALQSLLNVAAEEDDDGNAAVSKTKEAETRFTDARISPVNVRAFWTEARKSGKTNDQVAAFLATLGHKQTEELKQAEYEHAIRWAKNPLPVPQDMTSTLQASVDLAKSKKAPKEAGAPADKPKRDLKKLYAVAEKAGVPEADFRLMAKEIYKAEHLSTDLTDEQYEGLIEWVESQATRA